MYIESLQQLGLMKCSIYNTSRHAVSFTPTEHDRLFQLRGAKFQQPLAKRKVRAYYKVTIHVSIFTGWAKREDGKRWYRKADLLTLYLALYQLS